MRPSSCGELVEQAQEALGLIRSSPTVGRRALLVALAAVVAVGVAAAIGATLLVGGDASPPASSGGALVRIDPATNEVTATHAVTAHPGVVTATSTRVWLGDFRDGSLWRLDPDRGDLKRFTTTGEPRDLTSLGDHIYVAGDGETIAEGTVTRYDAVTGAREGGRQPRGMLGRGRRRRALGRRLPLHPASLGGWRRPVEDPLRAPHSVSGAEIGRDASLRDARHGSRRGCALDRR